MGVPWRLQVHRHGHAGNPPPNQPAADPFQQVKTKEQKRKEVRFFHRSGCFCRAARAAELFNVAGLLWPLALLQLTAGWSNQTANLLHSCSCSPAPCLWPYCSFIPAEGGQGHARSGGGAAAAGPDRRLQRPRRPRRWLQRARGRQGLWRRPRCAAAACLLAGGGGGPDCRDECVMLAGWLAVWWDRRLSGYCRLSGCCC